MNVFLVEDSALLRSRLETMLAAIPGGVAHGARGFFDKSQELDSLRSALAAAAA